MIRIFDEPSEEFIQTHYSDIEKLASCQRFDGKYLQSQDNDVGKTEFPCIIKGGDPWEPQSGRGVLFNPVKIPRSMTKSEALLALPPSAKLVYKVLEYHGPLTQQAISEESCLSPRTTRYALSRLSDIDAVTKDVYFPDARQDLYDLRAQAKPDDEVVNSENQI